jgi:hypothetical protein
MVEEKEKVVEKAEEKHEKIEEDNIFLIFNIF